MIVRLTPMMETALYAMTRGALEWSAEGWRSSAGVDGCWNDHTILWLNWRGFCKAEPKVRARLTPDGRAAINALAGVAA